MPRIVCDVHEGRSAVPSHLAKLGAEVEIRALKRGDYLVAVDALVERKTIADFHSSIVKGRFWAQIGKIHVARRPYLFLEGGSIRDGPIAVKAARRICIAVGDLGVTIIRTEDSEDTAAWLLDVAAGGAPIRERPVFAQRPSASEASPAEAALASAPGVSLYTARAILDRFPSLSAVTQASQAQLQSVPGVGPTRAQSVHALMHERQGIAKSN